MTAHGKPPRIFRVDGPITLEWPNGTRITLTPESAATAVAPLAPERGRPLGRAGRKPSPATQALIVALEADAAGGTRRSRNEYLAVLRAAGYASSDGNAQIIIAREAKRAFGGPLGRVPAGTTARKATTARNSATGRKGGRQASNVTVLLREKMTQDLANNELGDARQYLRWVVAQPGVTAGLKKARPVVYRELRAVRPTVGDAAVDEEPLTT